MAPEIDPWTTFALAAQHFAGVVGRVESPWDSPGLGEWDLRSLVGHTSRALVTTSAYLQRPAETEDVLTSEDYYAAVLDAPAARAHAVDPGAVAARGREAGEALGDSPALGVHALVGDALARLADREDRLVTTPVGGMRVSSYLPTRTFELAVHALDVGRATGLAVRLPPSVLDECAVLAARVGVRRGRALEVLGGLTGRTSLPDDFTVV